MYYSSLNKHDSNELNFVHSIRVIMCQHYMNSETNIALFEIVCKPTKAETKDVFQARHILLK